MQRFILSTIFTILLISIFIVQFFVYKLEIKEIVSYISLFSVAFGGIALLWSKLVSPTFNSIMSFFDYVKTSLETIEFISSELKPNHGSSIKDSIKRIESKILIIETELNISNDHGDTAIFKCDKNGNYIAVNRIYCRLVGCSKDELLGLGWKRFTEKIQDNWDSALKEGREVTFDITIQDIDENSISLEAHCFPIHDLNGNLSHFLGFLSRTDD